MGLAQLLLHGSAVAISSAQDKHDLDLGNKKSQWIVLLASVVCGPLNGLA